MRKPLHKDIESFLSHIDIDFSKVRSMIKEKCRRQGINMDEKGYAASVIKTFLDYCESKKEDKDARILAKLGIKL